MAQKCDIGGENLTCPLGSNCHLELISITYVKLYIIYIFYTWNNLCFCMWNFITLNWYLWNYGSSDFQIFEEICFDISLHGLKNQGNAFEMIKYFVFYGSFTNRYHFQAVY